VDESTTVNQFGDLSTGNFLRDHIVIEFVTWDARMTC